jgi:WXG100 family type VII secretion target
MSEIKVTFGALVAAQADVAGTAARIFGRLDDLHRAVAPLAATWQGQAAEAYQARQRQWDTAATDLARVLTDIGRALGDAEAGYRATENANASLWRRS